MSYTKEYDDAISRLNAGERTPLPYAPIPYGPVPNHCNYANWNRIMMETRQGNLPKYSIMQRCYFDEQNKWAGNVPSKDYYVYKLDPSFVFAKGDRKSIAIRNVEVYPPLKIGEKFTTTFTLNMNLHINNAELDDPPTGPHFEIKDFEIPVEGTLQEDYDLTIDEWQGDIGGYFGAKLGNFPEKKISDSTADEDLVKFSDCFEHIKVVYKDRLLGIYMQVKELSDKGVFSINAEESELNPNAQILDLGQDFAEYLNQTSQEFKAIKCAVEYYKDLEGDDHQMLTLQFRLQKTTINFKYGSLCSDINPWTAKNIISGYSFHSDSLTKVYPYNRNDEARFWFLDVEGNPIKYDGARGYIDLELIIDNSNTFAMDT